MGFDWYVQGTNGKIPSYEAENVKVILTYIQAKENQSSNPPPWSQIQ